MDKIKEYLEDGEQVIISSKMDVKMFIKSKLKSCLLVATVWVLMNVFFVYLLFVQNIALKYWFVSIPIIGFNILAILALYNGISKEWSKINNINYLLTDKAIYCYTDGEFFNITKIKFNEITYFEKDKNNSECFHICAKDKAVVMEYLPNQQTWYSYIAKKLSDLKKSN